MARHRAMSASACGAALWPTVLDILEELWDNGAAMDTISFPSSEALAELCRRWQIVEPSLFGSVARGPANAHSDVDLLVSFEPDAPWSILDLVDLREELASLFGRRVDLIEERAIRNPDRKTSILRDKSVLYAH
jgi:predicted nucleotidyltransferase